MQIPQSLPQFTLSKTLIIVSTTHKARFIGAYQGQASELHDYEVEKIKYSDREGHFLRRAFGVVLGSGSVYESKSKREMIEFLSEFETQAQKVTKAVAPDDIILLAPDYAEDQIKQKLPQSHKDKVSLVIHGNYIKNDIPSLLKLIGKESNKTNPAVPTSEEASKILNKGKHEDNKVRD